MFAGKQMGEMRVTFTLDLFQETTEKDIRRSRAALLAMFEALVTANEWWLKTYPYPITPTLYQSEVVYVREPEGREDWQDIPTTIRRGNGDCEDLAAWRVAELRHVGIRAEPFIRWDPTGTRYHALVRWPGGKIEDPSLALGMHGTILRQPIYV